MSITITKAQENLSYQLPAESILQLADYQRPPAVTIDSKKEYMLLSYRDTYKSLNDLNQQEISLAGLRVNPITNISSSINYITNLKIRKVSDNEAIQVKGLPAQPRITYLTWSPDETKVAFTNTTPEGVELWTVDLATAQANKLTAAVLNANLGNPFNWYRDSKSLLVRTLQPNRQTLIDPKKALPAGPIISISDGSKAQNRTYQDMLKNPSDEANFVTLTTSELYKIELNGTKTLFKSADMYAGENFSPDGNYILITTLSKPFSYIVPLNRFPQSSSVYDLTGDLVKTVNQVPLTEVLPKGFMAVRKGKRAMNWRSDEPATLFFAEALDEGDPKIEVEYRDAVYLWKAPFNQNPTLLTKTNLRFCRLGLVGVSDCVPFSCVSIGLRASLARSSALRLAKKLAWTCSSKARSSRSGSWFKWVCLVVKPSLFCPNSRWMRRCCLVMASVSAWLMRASLASYCCL